MKFMLLQHYGRVEGDVPPMSEWKPEDVAGPHPVPEGPERGTARARRAGRGAGADRPGAGEDRARHRRRARSITDGPFAESKELLAGWRTVDVESEERAIEIAAQASEGPGPDGVPLRQQIEVREVMGPIEP